MSSWEYKPHAILKEQYFKCIEVTNFLILITYKVPKIICYKDSALEDLFNVEKLNLNKRYCISAIWLWKYIHEPTSNGSEWFVSVMYFEKTGCILDKTTY